MRARYLGDHVDMRAFGISFPRGVYVEVTDTHAQTKIRGNNHFEVESDDIETVEFKEVESASADPTVIGGADAEPVRAKPGRKPKH